MTRPMRTAKPPRMKTTVVVSGTCVCVYVRGTGAFRVTFIAHNSAFFTRSSFADASKALQVKVQSPRRHARAVSLVAYHSTSSASARGS